MVEFSEIKKLLTTVKSKIDVHKEFKKEYNKQLAFDFSLFNFFNVGENKVSQILAYFLDEKQNHGQGNIFLNEFIDFFYQKKLNINESINICEKVIENNRRIDIYIELPNTNPKKIIAIENKIWAPDQKDQLRDYAKYLEKKAKGNFLLLYLNPYGEEPSEKSIDTNFKQKLIDKKQFKIISYKEDIINLINKWLVICEADNVSHFIKEFKKFIEFKFLGNNTLNMSKNLRELIYKNEIEVKSLVNEYSAIETEIIQKLNAVGKILDEENPKINSDLEISKSGLFNWPLSNAKLRIYKYSISKGKDKIWIEFIQNGIYLFSNYYLEEDVDAKFKDATEIEVKSSNLNKDKKIDYKQSEIELVRIFLEQVKIAVSIFNKYDKFTDN